MIGQLDNLVEDPTPLVRMVVDDENRPVVGHHGDLVSNRAGRFLVEHRDRLVEEEQPGVGGQDSGDDETLHLPARHLRGGVVTGNGEPGTASGVLDDRPDLLAGNAMILRTKGDVTSTGRGNDGVDRLLLQQTDVVVAPRTHLARQIVTLLLQQPSDGVQQGRFASTRRPCDKHPCASRQVEVDGPEDGGVAARDADSQPLDIHWHRPTSGNVVNLVITGQDVSHDRFRADAVLRFPPRSSRETAKGLRAPAAARPRTIPHASSPPSSAPETTMRMR